MDAQDIAGRLREIAGYLRLLGGDNPWKARAYDTAAASVEVLGPGLDPLIAQGRLTEAPGIGEAIAGVITELARSGTTARLEALRAELPPGLLELADLPGMTGPRLRALHAGLGIRDRGELQAALDGQRVRTLKGFGPRTEEKLRQALAR